MHVSCTRVDGFRMMKGQRRSWHAAPCGGGGPLPAACSIAKASCTCGRCWSRTPRTWSLGLVTRWRRQQARARRGLHGTLLDHTRHGCGTCSGFFPPVQVFPPWRTSSPNDAHHLCWGMAYGHRGSCHGGCARRLPRRVGVWIRACPRGGCVDRGRRSEGSDARRCRGVCGDTAAWHGAGALAAVHGAAGLTQFPAHPLRRRSHARGRVAVCRCGGER